MSQPDVTARPHMPFWALLIGIDVYRSLSIRNLRGCRNDVAAMQDFLLNNLKVPDTQIMTLLDDDATRDGILQAFRRLCDHPDIRPGDQILIHYSGHGALMRPPVGWDADFYIQSLVPYDGGVDGSYNIPDRTLGALLDSIAARLGTNITVILDACHSGSGTRALDIQGAPLVRQTVPDLRLPPDDLDYDLLLTTTGRSAGPSGWPTRGMPYVLLAGCRDLELANEYRPAGSEESWNGAMTYFTLELLRDLAGGPPVTYSDLYERVAAKVNMVYPAQIPQCEGDGRNRVVFGSASIDRDPLLLVDRADGTQIVLRAGLLHGCTPGSILHLYTADAALRTKTDLPEHPVTFAEVISATATTARAQVIAGEPHVEPLTRGVIAEPAIGIGRLQVLLRAEDTMSIPIVAELVASLDHPATAGGLLEHQQNPNGPFDLFVLGKAGVFSIYAADGSLLVSLDDVNKPGDQVNTTLSALKSIARYRALLTLEPAGQSLGLEGKVRLRLRKATADPLSPRGEPLREERPGEVVLVYDAERHEESRYLVDIINISETPVYPHLFVLSPDFSIDCLYPTVTDSSESAIKHQQGTDGIITVGLDGASALSIYLPEGWNSCRDYLKVIATTKPTDLRLLEQQPLSIPTPTRGMLAPDSALAMLVNSALSGTRFNANRVARADELWSTASLILTVVRQERTAQLLPGLEHVPLSEWLSIRKPDDFAGAARVVPVNDYLHTDGAVAPPPALARSEEFAPVLVPQTRSVLPQAFALELEYDDQAQALVSTVAPLLLDLTDGGTNPSEQVLAIAFDGKDYLFVGSDDQTPGIVRVDWLPTRVTSSRGVLNTVRLFLYRKMGRFTDRLGLRRGIVREGKVVYEPVVPDHFRPGDSVAICLHGFNSDTRWMVRDVGPFLRERVHSYTHLLTFDYESFGTSIEESAERFAQALARTCGFSADDQLRIDIYAHSMGGLVARCAIELFGASAYIDRLVMAGTPNRGSTLASTGRGLAFLATAMLNELGKIPPLGLLQWTLEEFHKQGVGMADLEVDSDLLRRINRLVEPNTVAYLVLASAYRPTDHEQRQIERLMRKVLTYTSDQLFGEPNDLVVGQSAAVGVRGGFYPRLTVVTVDCSHFAYFHDPASRAAMAVWLRRSTKSPDGYQGKEGT